VHEKYLENDSNGYGRRNPEQIEYLVVLIHRLCNITKVVGEALETTTVCRDGHITLAEGVELGLDVHGTSGSVVMEETLNGSPDVEGSFFRLHHHVLQLTGTGGVEPISDGGVIHCPLRRAMMTGSACDNMMMQSKLCKYGVQKVMPLQVV
jgi:hypothetical protein